MSPTSPNFQKKKKGKNRLRLLNYFCIIRSSPSCKILKELHDLHGVTQGVGSHRLFRDRRNDYRVPLSPSCNHLGIIISFHNFILGENEGNYRH